MQSKELDKPVEPKELKAEAEAFLKGKYYESKISIPKHQAKYIQQKVRKTIRGNQTKDAQRFLDLALDLKNLDPNMLIKVDHKDNKFQNFIFSSSNMKLLYKKFNDIILIDSTYKTNKYKLPLLVFAGINEQAQTFVFGFGFVQSEIAKNVSWVFENLFNYLGEKPRIICSDSCLTLKKVIKDLLPETTHLLCGWHVSQNIKSHILALSISTFLCLFLLNREHFR